MQVAPGGTIAGTADAPTDLIILSQGSFLNANAVASALAGGSYNITHSTATAGTNYDFLLAYQGIDGNAHLADLHFLGTGGSTHTGTGARPGCQRDRLRYRHAGRGELDRSWPPIASHVHLVS